MANQEHLDILKQGVKNWNKWRQEHLDIQPDLSRADLDGADLEFAELIGAKLSGAHLTRADLTDAHCAGADLSEAFLTGAYLIGTSIPEGHLTGAHLAEAHLTGAHLDNADLKGAFLVGAELNGAILRGADLTDANLAGVDLEFADLTDANLAGANLDGAKLIRTNLSHTNLSSVRIGGTVLGDVDLRQVRGLETLKHEAPSTLGMNTILRSEGDIPEVFLQGVGVNDTFITYIRSLVGKAIEYYSCFISYSSKDETFAKRLYTDLQSKGVRCWFAPQDMKIGDKIRSRLDEAILMHDKLLLVLSENSVESTWVEKEVETAFEKERRQNKLVLFPVKLDDCVMQTAQAWAADIRRMRHIGDFRNWKNHDDYQKALNRLLHDLKAEA